MSEKHGSTEPAANRRKRVNRLKRIILATVALLILIPTVTCVVLAIRVGVLQDKLDKKGVTTIVYESNDSKDYESGGKGNQPTGQEMMEEMPETLKEPSSEKPSEEPMEEQIDMPVEPEEPEASVGEKEPVVSEVEDNKEEIAVRKVYFTFDDGPSENTDKILDVLAEYDVKATFFVIGKTKDYYIPMYQRIVEEGHSLGMHSFSHEYTDIYESVENFRQDLHKIQDYLYDVTGQVIDLYRFPGGSSNGYCRTDIDDYLTYLRDYNISYFDWNVSSEDASEYKLTKEEIVNNVISRVDKYETVVVLFHDAAYRDTTVEALPEIIEKIQAMENTVILPITDETELVQHRWLE
ncbi:MAG: polysaccharide deacetylase [Clostridium sp.]|nr:polysaccharide deacetylase [Lachnospiraceae bacterium]MBR3770674.1 polysaccharide deacetylase [Clostridium sp.]